MDASGPMVGVVSLGGGGRGVTIKEGAVFARERIPMIGAGEPTGLVGA